MTREEVRAYDRDAIARGVPGIVLMENAAKGATGVLFGLGAAGPVAIVCGKGNNAGDGFVMARLLAERGIVVTVDLVGQPAELKGDARTAFERMAASGIEAKDCGSGFERRLAAADWIVDALLGTGTAGPIRPPFDRVIEDINAAGRPVLAVDLPSGLDFDTGDPLGPTIRATHTVTFVARKRGFDNPASVAYTGEVHVVSIL
jgi:NAD(P)H-hydrate epimerase